MVLPLKFFPLFTNFAKPANCSAVEISNFVLVALYHEVSAVPSQMVCACKPVKVTSAKSSEGNNFFILCSSGISGIVYLG